MLKSLSMISLLVAGVIVGIVLSGRATNDSDIIAGTPAAAAPEPAEQAVAPIAAGAPDFTRVAAQTVRAVTNISSVQVVRRSASPFQNDPFFQYFFGDQGEMFGRSRAEQSLGSGVVISSDGFVVTNNHVIGDDVAEVTVTVGDHRDVKAKIIGVDSWTDLALLKIDRAGLPVIPWGDSSKLKVAEWVMAVGNPFSLNQTVTLGIVSALGRANVGITQYEDFIQTDAAINPGNSGGALINARGELIGINTAIFSQSGGYQGIGFAVPSNLARRVMDDLIKYGEVRRGSIGPLETIPLTTQLAEELGVETDRGAVVARMSRSGTAYQAGLRPGDVIVSMNGKPIDDPGQFLRMLSDTPSGTTVAIGVVRGGGRQEFKVRVTGGEARQR